MKIDNIQLEPEKHLVNFDLNDFEQIIPLIIKTNNEITGIGFKDKEKNRGIMIKLPRNIIQQIKDLL